MVSCLEDIVDVIRSRRLTGVNIPQLVGREDGEFIVKQRDWQSFLKQFFRRLPGIAQHKHYRYVIYGSIVNNTNTNMSIMLKGCVCVGVCFCVT